MKGELTKLGVTYVGIIIKKVKGRYYVYEYARVSGKPVYRYVGPLEEVVRVYEAVKAGITVNHTKRVMRTKDLRRLARMIADNLMEVLKNPDDACWWARGDSNPGPPGYQPGAPPG